MIPKTSQTAGRDEALLVETRGLTEHCGARITAVDDLDLGVRRGEVYGFLATLFRSTALAIGLGLFYALALKAWSSACRSRTNPSRRPANSFSGRTPAFSPTPSPEAPCNSPSRHQART